MTARQIANLTYGTMTAFEKLEHATNVIILKHVPRGFDRIGDNCYVGVVHGLCTVHQASPVDAVNRLDTLCLEWLSQQVLVDAEPK